MALSKENLKNSLLNLFKTMQTNNSPENSVEVLADQFAQVLYDFVKTGEVQAGQSVATTGSASAQTGKTTTNGTIV